MAAKNTNNVKAPKANEKKNIENTAKIMYIASVQNTAFHFPTAATIAAHLIPHTETSMKCFLISKRNCCILPLHTVTPTELTLKRAKMQMHAIVPHSLLSGRLRWASEARSQGRQTY